MVLLHNLTDELHNIVFSDPISDDHSVNVSYDGPCCDIVQLHSIEIEPNSNSFVVSRIDQTQTANLSRSERDSKSSARRPS